MATCIPEFPFRPSHVVSSIADVFFPAIRDRRPAMLTRCWLGGIGTGRQPTAQGDTETWLDMDKAI
ncbi:hypothetical protein GCM10022214_76460 [Actinomadura miaoliensis]|uniref:Uncharacterized protein n=1 Tax=Actinomadura miaoliensis TaxID=430685 RepID=A0ABP7X0W3_9ACTN